jgi:beta-glucanase (GH16 family)
MLLWRWPMKSLAFIFALLALIHFAPQSPTATATAAGHWKLVWNDEFTSRRLDLTHWTVTNTFGEALNDGELNSYTPDELSLANQNLVIRTRPLPNPRRAQPYLSGRVTTKGKFSFLYGKIEVRAKLPKTKGLWPAIWMLPDDRSWPPEIDIIELLGDNPRKIYMTDHWVVHAGRRQDESSFTGPDFSADFHVFTLEWMPNQLRWLIDGVERKVMTEHVPSKAMYLILNTAVGGDWAGAPDKTTVFPQYFTVDYVRIYQHHRD